MAKIVPKSPRRSRISFSLPLELAKANKRIIEQAEVLAVAIDYSRDFERWFKTQMEQVCAELQQLEQARATKEQKEVSGVASETAPATVRTEASVVMATPAKTQVLTDVEADEEDIENGDD